MEGLVVGVPSLGRGGWGLGGVACWTRQPPPGAKDVERHGTVEKS